MWVLIDTPSGENWANEVYYTHLIEICKQASEDTKIALQPTFMTASWDKNLILPQGAPHVVVDPFQPDKERDPYTPTNIFERCWVASEITNAENSIGIICISRNYYHMSSDDIAEMAVMLRDYQGCEKTRRMVSLAVPSVVENMGKTQVFLNKSNYALWYMINASMHTKVSYTDLGIYGFYRSFLDRYWQSESAIEESYLNVPMMRCLENGQDILYKIIYD